jgi:hypothetical protein
MSKDPDIGFVLKKFEVSSKTLSIPQFRSLGTSIWEPRDVTLAASGRQFGSLGTSIWEPQDVNLGASGRQFGSLRLSILTVSWVLSGCSWVFLGPSLDV